MSEQSARDGAPPEITPRMRASARANPGTWLYVIDPAFDADADIPPWGVAGAYPVNAGGEIDAAFRRNTGYRPSPAAPHVPDPASDLERALRLAGSGQVDQSTLPAAVLRAPLLLYATSPGDRAVTGFPTRQGTVVVPACTSVAHVPSAWPGWREITGRDLVPLLHGHPLVINPAGPFAALIPAEHLSRASG
ncbi:MAG TPA: type VII secretion system-associated protein [Actinophytocola sp.]|uniref:type VII secretion system-associated protein n=1 Tax=Actinophytocola sp. TaxID=1872138 RepID=UPI002F948FC2